jgi:hypothetical protein
MGGINWKSRGHRPLPTTTSRQARPAGSGAVNGMVMYRSSNIRTRNVRGRHTEKRDGATLAAGVHCGTV